MNKIDFSKIENRNKIELTNEEYKTLKEVYKGMDKLVLFHYKESYYGFQNGFQTCYSNETYSLILPKEKDKKIQDVINKKDEEIQNLKGIIDNYDKELKEIKCMSIKEFKKLKKL